MGNFRQHVGVAGATGVAYAWGAQSLTGLHWLYGSTAALLVTVGGVLPDLDHPLGVEIKALTTFIGTLGALIVWRRLHASGAALPIEAQVWIVLLMYVALRVTTRSVLTRIMVHRGMSHSVPTCLAWGAATYLVYPSPYHPVKVWMAGAVMLGFTSHLLLDEVCSVDLRGQRIKRSFGSALKLWGPSLGATVTAYAILYFLARAVLNAWPPGPPLDSLRQPVPPPEFPPLPNEWRLPAEWLKPFGLDRASAGGGGLPASIGGAR